MNRAERYLYHQIHPVKLLIDFGTSFASTWLLWEQRWWVAIAVAFGPSIAASVILIRFVELERYKHTLLGHYLASSMTHAVEAARLLGQLLMWGGAVAHIPWLIPFGFVVIVFAWLSGLLRPA